MNAADQTLVVELAKIAAGPDLSFAKGQLQGAGEGEQPAIEVVPVSSLRVRSGYNVRLPGVKREARVATILQSILANGYLQDKPMTCLRAQEDGADVYYIVAGHTRLEAIQRANAMGENITQVPIICLPAGTSYVDLVMDLVLSNNNAQLGMYEQGLVNERLVADGLSVSEIARRQGFTEGHIRNTLELRAAPYPIVEWLANDVISETLALNMIRKHGEAAVEVIQAGLSRATSLGKGRVTAAAVDGPKIPVKVGASAVSAVESFISKLDPSVLQQVFGDQADGVAVDDETEIVVKAGTLRALMDARNQIADFRVSVVEKEDKAKERVAKAQKSEERKARKAAEAAAKEARKQERLQKRAEKTVPKPRKQTAKTRAPEAVAEARQVASTRRVEEFDDGAAMRTGFAPAPDEDDDGRVVDRSDVDDIPTYD